VRSSLRRASRRGFFVGGTAVLLEGLFGDEQGEEFAFGDLEGGEGFDGAGVMVTEAGGVVGDGEVEAVAHELDVAEDGLGADFEGIGEVGGVGVFAGTDGGVDAHHPFDGWTRVKLAGRRGDLFWAAHDGGSLGGAGLAGPGLDGRRTRED